MGVARQVLAGRTSAAAELRAPVTIEGLRHVAGNIGLALMFFIAAVPGGGDHHLTRLADVIWSAGMILIGVFCAMRPRPSAVMLDWRAMLSGTGAFVLPALMARTALPSTGPAYQAAIALELAGVTLSQVARIYMGHTFAVLPANRGIVSNGPFHFVRHPVYLGCLLFASGFAAAYPSLRNFAMLAASVALTVWRIELEEELLGEDPEYRSYLSRVRVRMIPGVY